MKIHYTKVRLSIIIVVCLFFSELALAEVVIESYEFGIAKQWRRNDWVPLSFVVSSSNESFVGKIVAQVSRTSTVSMPLSLSYKDRKADNLYLFINEITPQVSLNLINTEGETVDSYTFIPKQPKSASDVVILVITNAKDVLRNLEGETVESKISAEKGRIHVSYIDSFRNLPKHWIGYSSIDTIIIKDISMEGISFSQVRRKALTDWITSGGTLLISGGQNYQYLKNEFIKSLLPVEFTELSSSSELDVMNDKFGFNFEQYYSFDLIKSQLKRYGDSIIKDNGTPIVAKREFGNGRIVFMAFDYSVRPFSDEPGFSQFWSWFTNNWAKSEIRKEMVYEPYRRHEKKIRELLASNLSTKTPLIQFTVVFLILYILIILFGNFIIKRYIQNAKLIIILNLVVIAIFTVFISLSQQFWKNDILFKELSILEFYPETNKANLSSYSGLIGERSTLHTLEFTQPVFLKSLTTSDLEIIQNRNFKLKDISIAPWSMNTFNLQIYLDIEGSIRKQETNQQYSILVSNNLPFSLEDVCVIYQSRLGKTEEVKENSQVEIELDKTDLPADEPIPPVFGSSELRREFLRIIANEGLLRYLQLSKSPILMGWINKSFLKVKSNNYTFNGETLFICR